jgi:hypothetical protein
VFQNAHSMAQEIAPPAIYAQSRLNASLLHAMHLHGTFQPYSQAKISAFGNAEQRIAKKLVLTSTDFSEGAAHGGGQLSEFIASFATSR